MIIIRASDTEIELSGTPTELGVIAQALSTVAAGRAFRFAARSDANPEPYDRLLVVFEAEASEGPMRLFVDADTLRATGSPEMFRVFGSYFSFPADTDSGAHNHHDYFEGDRYIAADSRSLVISVE